MTISDESAAPHTGDTGIDYFIDCPTGTVEYYFGSPTFQWSDELFRIHGYERGDVVPTLELGLAHIEAIDRDRIQAFWDRVSTTKGPASAYASLRSVDGKIHKILMSADLILDGDTPVGVWGLVVDLTRSIHADRHQLANEAVAASTVSRAVIEQAKGILMSRHGINALEAFQRISSYSQNANRKVVIVAQDIIDLAHHLHRGTSRTGPDSELGLLELLTAQ
ncbi:PAS sensor protein [Arthrobacter agilis]|uniref:PAS sensor protein n=1 Tax=Arthrobacter agilis TaxID=37921 RepID=A0A2L0UGF7_9MICC|nr:ANTAR domain-containing protein [Arthrobacter agilis]AUZ88334.1 PAS sensor protein [Arthrobacter agilis]